MMKSFFKKLAFVMALAMVVTLAAPAAQTAVAAEKKDLAIGYQEGAKISTLNLKNIGDTEDLRFLYAPANWKELGTPIWRSSNTEVVDVDANGVVTAKGAGQTQVMVLVGAEMAVIDVYCVDMKKFEATIGTPEDRAMETATMKVGDKIDFAFYGIEDYSADRYNCEWFPVDPEGILDVCDFSTATPGLVTAKKAGTAKLTLAVINLVTMQRTDVAAVTITVEEEVKVTPVPKFEVVNLKAEEEGAEKKLNSTQNTVKFRFDKATDVDLYEIQAWEMFVSDDDNTGDGNIDTPDNLYEYHTLQVYSVEADDETKKVWTVTMFDDFVDGVRYKFDPDGDGAYKAEEFVASVDNVATVEVVELQSALLEHADLALRPAVLDVDLYDDCWVDVTTRVVDGVMNNDPANITYEVVDSVDYSMSNEWVTWVSDWTKANAELGQCIFERHHYMGKDHYHCTIDFYEATTAVVQATYDCVVNSKTVNVQSAAFNVTPNDQNDYDPGRVIRWTLVEPGKKADWAKTNHTVPAGEIGYTIAALIEDGRGNLFTTHADSAGTTYDNRPVYWTEDHTEDFWSNGYYVKFRAMEADTMLIEEDGTVASYKEAENIYFSMFLYDYTKAEDDYVRSFYSNVLSVCHPKKLVGFDADQKVVVLTKTQRHETDVENAYWELFSKGKINVTLKDLHGGEARADHAAAAEFDIEVLFTESKEDTIDGVSYYNELKDLIEEGFLGQLTATNGAKREITFDADDFTVYTNRTQVKFRITEKTTGVNKVVTIVLQKPAAMDGESAQVHLVPEFDDEVQKTVYFDNYVPVASVPKVGDRLSKPSTLGTKFMLAQVDKNGQPIGFDNDLFISNTLDVNDVEKDDIAFDMGDALKPGDRVIFIKDPNGKVFAQTDDIDFIYKNPAYTKAEDNRYPMASETTGLGIKVSKAGDSESASGSTVDYYQYQLVTSYWGADTANERVNVTNGKYQVTIRTVERFENKDADPALEVVFTTSTTLKSTFTVDVQNHNKAITWIKREKIRIDEYMPAVEELVGSYPFNDGINKYTTVKIGNNDDIKRYILEAIDFNWAEKYDEAGNLVEGTADLSTEDILYYEYIATPTNNQMVIKSVTFRVGATSGVNYNKDVPVTDEWYRWTTDVNWHLNFLDPTQY